MSGIKRFDAGSGVNERANGRFVRFADHERVVADLRTEADSLRKDAERYRWLRSGSAKTWEQPWVAIGPYDNEPTDCTGKDLDNRMDEAMGAKA